MTYYSDLYNLKGHFSQLPEQSRTREVDQYISETALPTLPEEVVEDLDSPLTEEEVVCAIKETPAGKSPGPDGFTPKFYKVFAPQLSAFLSKVYNSIDSDCPFPTQALEATVTVIPKPGKDHSICDNYRPISLINVDLKLFAKILSSRLQPVIPKLIHKDQVGFVPGREARDNTIKVFDLMQWACSRSFPACLLACDAEKAFDRIDWLFLRRTLVQIGLGLGLLAKILALYTRPTARVRVNGVLSDPFRIANGTRQGCPLSPLLYVLVMEHLAVAIRNNPSIQGIICKDNQYKLPLW